MHLLKKSAFALLLLGSTALSAVNLDSGLMISTGYRNDTIHRDNRIEFVPPTVGAEEKIRVKDISIWQVGLEGRYRMPQFDCFCDSFLNNFYIDGSAAWGWGIGGGKIRSTYEDFSEGLEVNGRAKIRDERTSDYQIGLGYVFDWDCWGLGLSAGYAYNRQKHGAKDGSFDIEPGTLFGSGYKTTTTWKGPWIGAEVFYQMCAWNFGLGYEYHFARYSASQKFGSNAVVGDFTAVSDSTKAHNASGNVVFIDAGYTLCNNWVLGTCFKYKNYDADHGKVTSALTTDTIERIKAKGRWTSYSIDFGVGYSF